MDNEADIRSQWLARAHAVGRVQSRHFWIALIAAVFFFALRHSATAGQQVSVPLLNLQLDAQTVLASGPAVLALLVVAALGSMQAWGEALEQYAGKEWRTAADRLDLAPNVLDLALYTTKGAQPARPTADGRTVLVLSPLEFLAALSRLIPPPRVHRHRYHGVLAPNARLRKHVVALGRHGCEVPIEAATRLQGASTPHPAAAPEIERPATDPSDSSQRTAARSRWARLLARIYEVFPLLCPDCGAQMRILAFLTEPEPLDAILCHLGLPATPPPLAPARGPPQHDLGFDADPGFDIDQTPAYDLTEPEPLPDFHFDQSHGA